jgi:uncharacterized protein with FMN-binding domain
MIALIAVITVLVLADVGIAVYRVTSNHPQAPSPVAQSGPSAPGHPCNHGAYVSAAAHAHKGGAYASKVARTTLGKNGVCSAPLPNAS